MLLVFKLLSMERRVKKEHLVVVAVCTTLLSLIPTAYAALISNSTTLFADLLRCLGEFFSILVSWIILLKMSRNDTARFNYGYGKLEQLAGIAVAAALFLTFLVSLTSGIRGVILPAKLENAEFGFVFALLSVLGNVLLWISNYITDIRSPSPIAESQWKLFRAKACATMVVVISLGTALTFADSRASVYVDPIGSIALSLFMLWQSYKLVSASVPDLIDYAIEETLQATLDKILSDHRQDYSSVEKVRSRRTARKIYIELFLAFPPEVPFGEVHRRVMLLKHSVESRFPGADITVIPSLPSAS
jgi:cation diffusion facilitator family transporter